MESSTGYIPIEDIHICGACRKQFSDVDQFVHHKKNDCPVLLSLQQSGLQAVSQSEVRPSSILIENQSPNPIANKFTIPLPSVYVHSSTGTGTGQGLEFETEPQPVVTVGKQTLGDYSQNVTTLTLGTSQADVCRELTTDSQVLQQPLGHEYVRTHQKRNKFYVQLNQENQLEQQETAHLATGNDENTDILTGSHDIAQYQTVQQEYVLQQVSQSEEVYDSRLIQLESQSNIPLEPLAQEPVYTLETHEVPPLTKTGNVAEENYISSNEDRHKVNETTDIADVTGTLLENELSFTLTQSIGTAGTQVYQQVPSIGTTGTQVYQQVPSIDTTGTETYQHVDSCDIEGHVPFVLNDSSPNKADTTQKENNQKVRPVAETHLTNSSEIPTEKQQTWIRLVNKDGIVTDSTKIISRDPRKYTLKDGKLALKVPPEKKFQCDYKDCSYRSAYMKDLERHYRIHTGEKPFSCDQCGKSFNRNDKLILHMRYHAGDRSFKCQLCEYSCVESGSLKKHMRIHNEEKPFKCQVCPYSSRSAGQLQIHLRSHTGDKPYVCSTCQAKFKVTSDLKRHMRIHTGEKPFACEHCDYRCSVSGNLKTHMRVNHSSNLEVTCNSCDFKSSSKRALREHMKAHDIFYDTKCDKCGYQCASRSALRNHMLQHNDSFVSCNYCDYKTKQRGNVIAHMKRKHPSTHFNRRKRGRRPRQLNKFEEENLDNACIKESHGNGVKFKARCKKTFKCTLCDSSFVREDSLKCHMKQHRDLSRASLSTAYAVLKLQQPIVNVNVQQDGNEDLAEMVDTEAPFIPHGAKAKSQVQTQPDSTGSSLRTGHNQPDTGQASSLGIKDILAAAGINNGSKDVSPSKSVYRLTDQAGSKNITSVTGDSSLVTAAAVTSEESLLTDLSPTFSISSSSKNVSSLQSMQNISLPYIKLPDGQVLILSSQSQISQTTSLGETPETYLATKETVSGLSQDGDHESAYQVMLEPVQNVSFSQHVTIPASAAQQGAIPIQIIVPSESQHSLPIVSQLLNSSINQNLAQKMSSQDSTTETPQNFVVHIPGNSGNLLKTSGPAVEGQSQSFVLQIPGPGPSYGINTDLQQHFASPGQGQLIQMGGDQSPGRQDVSA